MEIKMDPEAWGAIASQAIFDQMSQDARETVLKQAVTYLLTPEKSPGTFGKQKSPLQQAFEHALQQAAYKAVQEKIANDEQVRDHINSLLGPVIQGALEAEAENYNYGLSNAIGQAVGNWLAEQARKD